MIPLSNFQSSASWSAQVRSAVQNLQAHCLKVGGLIGLGLLSAIEPAAAHHAMSGGLPTNFLEGFLSGLAHPVIGLDHLAAVIALGLLSAGKPRSMMIPAAFLLTAMAGTGIHILSLDLPIPEVVIASSVIVFGVLLFLEQRFSPMVLAGLAAIAGLFHGYAYGEVIVGAKMSPLIAYLAGFTLIQYGIAMLGLGAGTYLMRLIPRLQVSPLRGIGLVMSAIGIVFLFNSITA